jgi:hypothetical protein
MNTEYDSASMISMGGAALDPEDQLHATSRSSAAFL